MPERNSITEKLRLKLFTSTALAGHLACNVQKKGFDTTWNVCACANDGW